jgi:hypothetical protein
MSDTFKSAFTVFDRELGLRGLAPEPRHITTIAFAIDSAAAFEFAKDDLVIVHFSDGSTVTIHPATAH